ncbi:hypothetical protein B0H13DRAFT_2155544 [Mycena leptocephala]|nr:hypothetical protein B0H13DRAFT_2155544 [Mycena leptocephala]
MIHAYASPYFSIHIPSPSLYYLSPTYFFLHTHLGPSIVPSRLLSRNAPPPPSPHLSLPPHVTQISFYRYHCYLPLLPTYLPSLFPAVSIAKDGRTPWISVAGESDAPRGHCGVAWKRHAKVTHRVLPRGLPSMGGGPWSKAHSPRRVES